jgi:hypothetical protein
LNWERGPIRLVGVPAEIRSRSLPDVYKCGTFACDWRVPPRLASTTRGTIAPLLIFSFCLVGLVQQSQSKMAAGGETAQSEARGGAGGGESPGTRGSPANQLGLQLHVLLDPSAHRDHGGHVQVSTGERFSAGSVAARQHLALRASEHSHTRQSNY